MYMLRDILGGLFIQDVTERFGRILDLSPTYQNKIKWSYQHVSGIIQFVT